MDRVTARDPAFVAAVRARVRGRVREQEPVARYSTYRIGGPATVLLPAVPEDIAIGLRLAREFGLPWFVVGLGSNLLFPDEGLDALVIRLGKGLDAIAQEGHGWRIGAGLPGPLAARRTAEAGYAGLHKFVGVPGSVGGGVYMNAGCHGAEWSEVVEEVTIVDAGGHDAVLARSDIPFSYRRSGLEGYVLLDVRVCLRPEEPAHLNEEVAELFRWRQQGTPFNQPCCGSVFKNPAGPSWQGVGQRVGQRFDAPRAEAPRTAGQLIEAAALKGARIGGAEVSPMHANYFTNTGTASAADVRALIARAQQVVADRFGIALETEVKLIAPDGSYLKSE